MYILRSFIKWSGLRVVQNNLREMFERSGGAGPVMHVIVTRHMRTTDPKAVLVLRELPRTDGQISYVAT